MTCNCFEKLAAAIREENAKYPHAEGAMLLGRIADALSPPPSAPVPEACMVVEYPPCPYPFGIETADRERWWNQETGTWRDYSKSDPQRHYGTFDTRKEAEAELPAAAAALRAAYAADAASAKPRSRWINIRRVGGENDPNARFVVEYQIDGRTIYLGEERVGDNFSHGWNLSVREAAPADAKEAAQ